MRPAGLGYDILPDLFQSTHPARGATSAVADRSEVSSRFQSTHPARGATTYRCDLFAIPGDISIHAPREGCDWSWAGMSTPLSISIHAPREGCDALSDKLGYCYAQFQSTHPARGATAKQGHLEEGVKYFNPRTPRGVRLTERSTLGLSSNFNPRTPRGVRPVHSTFATMWPSYFNPRTPRGVRQQTLPKSREFAWLNSLICTRGRRLSIQKQTRLCSIKLSFMLFGCEPAGEGVSSWTSHATKSKVRLEGRSAYSQSVRSSAHSDFPRNKSGDCPVRGP